MEQEVGRQQMQACTQCICLKPMPTIPGWEASASNTPGPPWLGLGFLPSRNREAMFPSKEEGDTGVLWIYRAGSTLAASCSQGESQEHRKIIFSLHSQETFPLSLHSKQVWMLKLDQRVRILATPLTILEISTDLSLLSASLLEDLSDF